MNEAYVRHQIECLTRAITQLETQIEVQRARAQTLRRELADRYERLSEFDRARMEAT
jgi:hypothetical protein